MTNPIELTRAEEEREQQQPEPRVVAAAPPGVVRCRASVPPDGSDCKAAAKVTIVWSDPYDKPTPVCFDCAKRLNQQAETHHKTLRIEPIR